MYEWKKAMNEEKSALNVKLGETCIIHVHSFDKSRNTEENITKMYSDID